jgi:hypothetical protein
MDLISHPLAESPIDELMACQRTLTDKFRRHDACREMGIVIRLDADIRSGKAGPD